MKFIAREVLLKTNTQIKIREVKENDAQDLIRTVKEFVEESEFIPYAEGEFNPTFEQELEWIKSMNSNPNSLCLLATDTDKIVGNISVHGNDRKYLKHTATIGMGMLKEYRSQGVGYALLSSAIEWAKAHTGLERLYLEVMSNNTQGIALYKKCGFSEDGRKTGEIKTPNSQNLDTIMMSLNVK